MAYKVIKDGATLQKDVGVQVGRDDSEIAIHSSKVYMAGDIVQSEDISAETIKAFESGDEHVCSLIALEEESKPPTKAEPNREEKKEEAKTPAKEKTEPKKSSAKAKSETSVS